ncbi:MAG TPA: hypothetical protein PLP33_14410 [Leptospiraceae bacterium]|nr:hypothetical protein [Leptospiraceae bacterium]
MVQVDVIQSLSEFLYYKFKYPNFSVVLQGFAISEFIKKNSKSSFLSENEKNFVIEFGEFLSISKNISKKTLSII